jgi:hypothetical protein
MMNLDDIKFEVLEDGTISVKTDQVSGVNHMSADELLTEMAKLAGGVLTKTKRSRISGGVKLVEHTHGGHTHQH